MRRNEDAFGRFLLDRLEGRDAAEIVERDDGFITTSGGEHYFRPRPGWSAIERQAVRFVRGRVLDVGCGAGRVVLDLQQRGRTAVGIDSSPLAVEVARRRGANDVRVTRVEDVAGSVGVFDTLVMFGNNLALLASRTRGPRLLRRLHALTSERGRIVGTTLDPYETDDEIHLAYHRRNRERGRMGGQARLRVRYLDLATPWFDYLFLSRGELAGLVDGTGWRVVRTIDAPGLPIYAAVLEKEGAA